MSVHDWANDELTPACPGGCHNGIVYRGMPEMAAACPVCAPGEGVVEIFQGALDAAIGGAVGKTRPCLGCGGNGEGHDDEANPVHNACVSCKGTGSPDIKPVGSAQFKAIANALARNNIYQLGEVERELGKLVELGARLSDARAICEAKPANSSLSTHVGLVIDVIGSGEHPTAKALREYGERVAQGFKLAQFRPTTMGVVRKGIPMPGLMEALRDGVVEIERERDRWRELARKLTNSLVAVLPHAEGSYRGEGFEKFDALVAEAEQAFSEGKTG